MKLVLYRNGGIILEVIENCGEVKFDPETKELRYQGGKIWPYKDRYVVLNDDVQVNYDTLLSHHKRQKIEELNAKCEYEIMKGFLDETTGYYFGFSLIDQMNFTQQYLLFLANPELSSVEWKTENAGVVQLSRDEFFAVCNSAERHKRSMIQKCWELKAQVEAAKSFDEVDAIKWT